MTRELIGARIQLAISQLLILEGDSHGVGRRRRLVLDELMQKAILWIINLSPVPFHDDLLALGFGEKRQVAKFEAGLGRGGNQQHLQLAQHAFDAGVVEKIGIVAALNG